MSLSRERLGSLLVILGFFALWEAACLAFAISPLVLPRPSEIGAACVMLASDMASHITGAVLDVDGGGEWPAFLAHTPNADELKPLELEVEGAL